MPTQVMNRCPACGNSAFNDAGDCWRCGLRSDDGPTTALGSSSGSSDSGLPAPAAGPPTPVIVPKPAGASWAAHPAMAPQDARVRAGMHAPTNTVSARIFAIGARALRGFAGWLASLCLTVVFVLLGRLLLTSGQREFLATIVTWCYMAVLALSLVVILWGLATKGARRVRR